MWPLIDGFRVTRAPGNRLVSHWTGNLLFSLWLGFKLLPNSCVFCGLVSHFITPTVIWNRGLLGSTLLFFSLVSLCRVESASVQKPFQALCCGSSARAALAGRWKLEGAMLFLPRPDTHPLQPKAPSCFYRWFSIIVCPLIGFGCLEGDILVLRWLFLHQSRQGGLSPCLNFAEP